MIVRGRRHNAGVLMKSALSCVRCAHWACELAHPAEPLLHASMHHSFDALLVCVNHSMVRFVCTIYMAMLTVWVGGSEVQIEREKDKTVEGKGEGERAGRRGWREEDSGRVAAAAAAAHYDWR